MLHRRCCTRELRRHREIGLAASLDLHALQTPRGCFSRSPTVRSRESNRAMKSSCLGPNQRTSDTPRSVLYHVGARQRIDPQRSEERRVGKEYRCGWETDQCKKSENEMKCAIDNTAILRLDI